MLLSNLVVQKKPLKKISSIIKFGCAGSHSLLTGSHPLVWYLTTVNQTLPAVIIQLTYLYLLGYTHLIVESTLVNVCTSGTQHTHLPWVSASGILYYTKPGLPRLGLTEYSEIIAWLFLLLKMTNFNQQKTHLSNCLTLTQRIFDLGPTWGLDTPLHGLTTKWLTPIQPSRLIRWRI